MSFFTKIKEAFGSKPAPKFKTYQPSELKMLAMKTRIILEKHMEILFQQITKEDQQFIYAGQDPLKLYNILQEIGQKVIEAESIKILVQMMRKVENFSPQIIKTNGDIALLRRQILWFQCVLWYRRSREKADLEDIYHFCYDFFKGVDITTQLDVHCEVFQLYPVLKYLPKKGPIPLAEILAYIQPYVSCNIDQPTLDGILDINRSDIAKGGNNKPQGQSYIHPGVINQPQSKLYPKNHVYTPLQPRQPQNQPSNINPYQSRNQNQSNIQPRPPINNPLPDNNSQVYNNSQFNPYNNINNPINPNGGNLSPGNNTFNDPNYNNMSNFDPSKLPNLNPYSQESNTLNINSNQNYFSRIENPQPQSPFQPHNTPSPTKPSFYNSLMRGNSSQRQPVEREQHQHYGSRIPMNRQTHEQFNDINFEQTMKELQQIEKKQSQNKEKKQNQQRQRQERERKQQQQKQKQRQRIQELRQQQLKEEMAKKQELERKTKEEEKKRQEQEEREREEAQRQRQQQDRRRERQREMQQRENDFEINVFRDNDREEIDRGTSGRFSTNFGMKIDFGDNREEQFSYESPSNIQSSLLRFKDDNEATGMVKNQDKIEENKGQQLSPDERQSLNIIMQNKGCNPSTDFKLFYFKKTKPA